MTSSQGLCPVSDAAAEIDRHVFATDGVAVGAFRCDPSHPLFDNSGPIRNHCVVFPRTSSVIQPSGFRGFVGNPNVVSIYNAGQEYRRRMVSPTGDHSDYFALTETAVRQVADERHPGVADAARAFSVSHVPASPSWYFRQRQIFRRAMSGHATALEIEEHVLLLVGEIVDATHTSRSNSEVEDSRGQRQRRALVEAAQVAVARRACDSFTLRELAADLGVSPYHLCRTFGGMTGVTLHQYRERLRLTRALDLIEAGDDLSRVALDVGYSSHSHFTAAFRRMFGVPPSAAR